MAPRCRSCGAEIVWARTTLGKAMPLDPEPATEGNVQLCMVGGEEIAAVLGSADRAAAQLEQIPLYVSHFATCPNAALHRKAPA
jgi:hypothetical protein